MPTDINSQQLTLELLSNPANLASIVLEDVEKRYNGEFTLVDPNNPVMHVIEMASTLTSAMAAITENKISTSLALRAQTSEDLYQHMSDYDYVNLFSSPASIEFMMTFDKKYLMNNGEDYDNTTKCIIIPRDTVIKAGNITFGLFYPIEILINKYTGSTIVKYETSVINPLYQLKYNVIPFSEYNYLGMNFIQIKFKIYQFVKTKIQETLTSQHGFASKYSYTDKFFALRLFTEKNGSLIELGQTLAKNAYDPFSLTARLAVEPEVNKFSVNIPQIYFTKDMLGTNLYLEVYTTKGDVNYDVSSLSKDQYKVNFNITKATSKYSQVLAKTTFFVSPVTTQLVGGGNGYSFEDLRQKVIDNAFHTTVLVTPADIESYYKDQGFRIVKYRDNLTNLIYFSYKVLADKENAIIPVTNLPIYVTEKTPDTVATIVHNLDDSITLLPNTIYKYDQKQELAIPLTDVERNTLAYMSKENKVEEFNNNIYLKTPFHIRLSPDGRYSKASSYNLMDPTIDNFIFERDNDKIMTQMVSMSGVITHEGDGVNGYKVQFIVNKDSQILEYPEEDLVLWVYTKTADNIYVGAQATYIGPYNNQYLYEFKIDTDYYISDNGKLNVTSLSDYETAWTHLIDLENEYHLTFMIKKDYFPDVPVDTSFYEGVPATFLNTHLVMIKQKCTINLGYSLDDVIYNSINLTWSQKLYKRYEQDEYATYPTDIYERNENGAIKCSVVVENGKPVVKLNLLHEKGDVIYDEYGNPEIRHAKGDLILDAQGAPILENGGERILEYLIQAMLIDYKLYLSEYPIHQEYCKSITKTLESYFVTIRDSSDRLLERDSIYFRPTRTLGSAEFSIGDGVTRTLPLDMTFSFRLHCETAVKNNLDIQNIIKENVLTLIEPLIAARTISLTNIADIITNSITYVTATDVLGINGDIDLQTIAIADDSVQPSIAQELYLTKDDKISIRKSIYIDFVID